MRTREGREVEIFLTPRDASGQLADVDGVELIIEPQTGSQESYTEADPEITLEGDTYYYRAVFEPGAYEWQFGAIKGGEMIDNKTGVINVEKRKRPAS